MAEQTNPKSNFEKIETVTSGYFTYIVGHFHKPDVYALGAMDLSDPASWSGGETAVVFYFLITPEEYAWLTEDRPRLDALAQKIQTGMPKNRFFSAISSKKGTKAETLKALCDQALKSDSLENDEAFDAWKKTVNFPKQVIVPKTPFTEARHNLAICQRSFQPKTATEEEKEAEAELERKLGWLLFKADELYAAYDLCFNPRFPMLETARGDVHIYSDRTLAENSAGYYEEHCYCHVSIKKLEQPEIKPFLRMCEQLGVVRFRLDDGLEPVTILLQNIIPNLDRGFIENFNCHVRGLMLRTMQTQRFLNQYGEKLEPERKAGVNDWFLTWNRMMLQELGKTTFFVPCGLPEKLQKQLKNQYAYTKAGLENIRNLMKQKNQTSQPIAHPGFTGKHAIVQSSQENKMPIRLLKTPDGKKWLVAFTSREDANRFVEKSKNQDVVVGMTLDELAAQAAVCQGVLVDPLSLAISLTEKNLTDAIKVRSEKVVIFRSQPAEAASDAAKAAEPSEEMNVPAAELPDAAEAAASGASAQPVEPSSPANECAPESDKASPETEDVPAEASSDDQQKKGGFFGRLFGKQ